MRYIAHKWLLFQESFSSKKNRLSCIKLGTFHFWKCNKEGCVSSFYSAWKKDLNELTLTKRCLMQPWFSADMAFLLHVTLFPFFFFYFLVFLFPYLCSTFPPTCVIFSICSLYMLQISLPFFPSFVVSLSLLSWLYLDWTNLSRQDVCSVWTQHPKQQTNKWQ
jgi:hypothetical protein